MMRGYLKAYSRPFSLSFFNPVEINEGLVTATKRGRVSKGFKSAKGLRANNQAVKRGIVVEVLRGQKKVLNSAFIALRGNSGNIRIAARGKYEKGKGFQFKNEGASTSLRGISVASALRSNNINPILKEYAENEYLRILYKELQKRVKSIGEQHAQKFL
jgi:hypothetical protein